MRTVDFDAAVRKHGTIIPELLAAMEIEGCAQEGLDPSEFRAFPSEAEALGAQNKPGCGLVGQKDGYVRLGFGALPEARFLGGAGHPRNRPSREEPAPGHDWWLRMSASEGRGPGTIRPISTTSATTSSKQTKRDIVRHAVLQDAQTELRGGDAPI